MQDVGTPEAMELYLRVSLGRRHHEEEAQAKLESLCAASWPAAKRKGDWATLTPFAEGACWKMKWSAEAKKLLAAFVDAAWRKANSLNTAEAYKTYLRSTGRTAPGEPPPAEPIGYQRLLDSLEMDLGPGEVRGCVLGIRGFIASRRKGEGGDPKRRL